MKYIFFLVGTFFLIPMAVFAQKKPIFTLVIDAGHGGKDPGKPRSKAGLLDEKEINLLISLKLGSMIEHHYENVKVVYTRKTDEYVSLQERVDITNRSKADCFLSIHGNSSRKKHIYGTQTHIHDQKSWKTNILAELIDSALQHKANRVSLGIQDHKDRKQHLFLLKKLTIPSVLIETGFLSHKADEVFLNSEEGQKLITNSLFRAFKNYLEKIKFSTVVSPQLVYKIQITASHKKIPLENELFDPLEMPVEEHFLPEKNDLFPFKYTIGHETEKKAVDKLLDWVRQKGFGQAFIITMRK